MVSLGLPPRAGSIRIVRNSALWYSEGSLQKAEARRAHRCVECGTPLPTGRTPYCGRVCHWRFQGRYFWDAARTYVIHRDRFTCQACRRRHRVCDLEVDHIVEIAAGGPSLEYTNLQTMCRSCHRQKTRRFLRERSRVRRSGSPSDLPVPSGFPEEPPDWFPS